jgi:hypothetical protein
MSEEESDSQSPEPDQQADERLIHALLLHMHDAQAVEQREQRVRKVMDAIRAPQILRFPAWTRRLVAAAAAMLLVAVGIWAFSFSSTPAMASLNEIISALARPGDRTFHLQMLDLAEPPGRGPLDDQGRQGSVPRPGLDNATLHLRDGTQYVLVRHDPNGGQIYDGFDGRQSWRVRKGVVAETKDGLGAGGIPMPPMMADVPFCDLHQTLEQIRVDYTVEQLDQAALAPGGQLQRHVLVRRNSRVVRGPETIEIWADPQTSMPRRIVFDRAKLQGSPAPCRLTLDLISEDALPPAWFSPSSHIAVEDEPQ